MLVLEQMIKRIGELPELPAFLEFSVKEKLVIAKYRKYSKGVEYWLRRLILLEPLPPNVWGEKIVFCRPMAEMLKALLDLCLELQYVYPNSFFNPHLVWFNLVCNKFQNAANFSGVVSKPLVTTKVNQVKNLRSLIKAFEEGKVGFVEGLTPEACILLLAQDTAKKNPPFEERAWLPFLKAWRKYINAIEKCTWMQFDYITPDGEEWVSGNGKKIPLCLQQYKSRATNYEEMLQKSI